MDNLLKNKKLMKDFKKHQHHYVLAALLAVFIVFDVKIPHTIASMVDSIVGKIAIIVLALSLFSAHPLVGSLALVAAYVLIMRSSNSTGSRPAKLFIPTETKKLRKMRKMNVKQETSLEESVIKNMIPSVGKPLGPGKFKPVLDKLHSAEVISQ